MGHFETVVRELTKLRSVTRQRSMVDEDLDMQDATMARGLRDIPADAVEAGCDAWAMRSEWFPTLHELRAVCIEAMPQSKRPRLPAPKLRRKSDKRWWYDWCALHDDPTAWQRARELYPTLFYEDGSMVPPDQVNFEAGDRVSVPFRQSAAYRELLEMDGPIGDVVRRMVEAVEPAETRAPSEVSPSNVDPGPDDQAVPEEMYERIVQLEREVKKAGGDKETLIFRQRARHRSAERQIAMLEGWIEEHEAKSEAVV